MLDTVFYAAVEVSPLQGNTVYQDFDAAFNYGDDISRVVYLK